MSLFFKVLSYQERSFIHCMWCQKWCTPRYITMTSHERHVVSNHRSCDCLFSSLIGPTSTIHQSPIYWSFVRGIHRGPVNLPHKGPVKRKSFHLMTSTYSSSNQWMLFAHQYRTRALKQNFTSYTLKYLWGRNTNVGSHHSERSDKKEDPNCCILYIVYWQKHWTWRGAMILSQPVRICITWQLSCCINPHGYIFGDNTLIPSSL